jgi:hypothetical protein
MRAATYGRFQGLTMTSAMIDAAGSGFVPAEAAGPLEQQHLSTPIAALHRPYRATARGNGALGTFAYASLIVLSSSPIATLTPASRNGITHTAQKRLARPAQR